MEDDDYEGHNGPLSPCCRIEIFVRCVSHVPDSNIPISNTTLTVLASHFTGNTIALDLFPVFGNIMVGFQIQCDNVCFLPWEELGTLPAPSLQWRQ